MKMTLKQIKVEFKKILKQFYLPSDEATYKINMNDIIGIICNIMLQAILRLRTIFFSGKSLEQPIYGFVRHNSWF